MPNNRTNPGQSPNGGQGASPQQAASGAADQVKQGAEVAANRLQEGLGQAREGALHGYRQAEGLVARNPGSSILVGFGVGMAFGLVLASMFTTKEETWAEKYLPDSLQDVPDQYKSLVSSLKSLPKTVHAHLPESVTKYLG